MPQLAYSMSQRTAAQRRIGEAQAVVITDRWLEWRAEPEEDAPQGREHWVLLAGTIYVPGTVRIDAIGFRGGPDVHMKCKVINSIPELAHMEFALSPEGRGIRSADLEGFQVEQLVRTAFLMFSRVQREGRVPDQATFNAHQDTRGIVDHTQFADNLHLRWFHAGGPIVRTLGLPDLSSAVRRDLIEYGSANRVMENLFEAKRGAPPALLHQVAAEYRKHVDEEPVQAVMKLFGYTQRTATRRIAEAREQGLLRDEQGNEIRGRRGGRPRRYPAADNADQEVEQ